MRLVVISEPPTGNPFKEFAWREVNIPPHGSLNPVYEWKLFPGFFAIPACWKVSLPPELYLATLRENAQELNPKDLPQECTWNVYGGDARESREIVTSLDGAKKRLEDRFKYEYNDWVEWRRVMNDLYAVALA